MKKDKEKVLDEVWTQEHIESFLDARPKDGSNEDFFILHRAYRNMRAADFKDFVAMYCQQKRDLNATDREGNTVLSIIQQHRPGAEYAAILEAAGAK